MPAGGMPNEPAYMNPASLYRGGGGEINGGFIGDSQSLSGSRKSLGPLQVRESCRIAHFCQQLIIQQPCSNLQLNLSFSR